MHGSRCTSAVAPAAFILLLSSLWVSGTRAEMPMQQLSREELVRIAGYGEERLSSVLVAGTLVCDACMEAGSDVHTSHVAGAKVAVACRTEGKKRIHCTHGTTDEFGEFMLDLPSHLHAIPKLEEACIVSVRHVPRNSGCRLIPGMKASGIQLSSVGNSIRVYTAGTLRLNSISKSFHRCSRKGDGKLKINL